MPKTLLQRAPKADVNWSDPKVRAKFYAYAAQLVGSHKFLSAENALCWAASRMKKTRSELVDLLPELEWPGDDQQAVVKALKQAEAACNTQ